MGQLRPYKDMILRILEMVDGVAQVHADEKGYFYVHPEFSLDYCCNLCKDNTWLYTMSGVSEIRLNAEQRKKLQGAFSREFGSTHLHIGAMIENGGKMVYVITAFVYYRWMGLREFRRKAVEMNKKMRSCGEWLKLKLPDFVQRELDINFAETHNLLMEGNYQH